MSGASQDHGLFGLLKKAGTASQTRSTEKNQAAQRTYHARCYQDTVRKTMGDGSYRPWLSKQAGRLAGAIVQAETYT